MRANEFSKHMVDGDILGFSTRPFACMVELGQQVTLPDVSANQIVDG